MNVLQSSFAITTVAIIGQSWKVQTVSMPLKSLNDKSEINPGVGGRTEGLIFGRRLPEGGSSLIRAIHNTAQNFEV
jgi:hypothetical protein